MYELFSAFFSNSYIFFSETTDQKSFIYHGLLRFFNQCDDHSATWHFYYLRHLLNLIYGIYAKL